MSENPASLTLSQQLQTLQDQTQNPVQIRQISLLWVWQVGMLKSLYLGFCYVTTSSIIVCIAMGRRSAPGLSSHAFLPRPGEGEK